VREAAGEVAVRVGHGDLRLVIAGAGAEGPERHQPQLLGSGLAEVVSYADFQRVGSMKEAKAQGVYRLGARLTVAVSAHTPGPARVP
jgi:hypothetical protein